MHQNEIIALLHAQHQFFREGQTLDPTYRLDALRRLKEGILSMEAEILSALQKDLGKSHTEGYLCELGVALSELRFMLRNVKSFSKPQRVISSLAQFPGCSRIVPTPYGTVLILSPWNYPFLLAIQPTIQAIAAGNTVVVKPSEYAPATSEVLFRLLSRSLPSELAVVIPGDHHESQILLEQPFDYIFYTGGPTVGRLVMEKAAQHLTPVTLELGGKSPCIVDETANIALAARRIVFGKFLNCGQTCVAPDYLLVQETLVDALISAIEREIEVQYGKSPLENPNYGKIINRAHFERLIAHIDRAKLCIGGEVNPNTLQIAPTVLRDVRFSDSVMREEIFGPILPVLTYGHLDEAVSAIRSRPHPLAFYLFSENKQVQRDLVSHLPFGGGCINDTILHLATTHMGFGGVGESGMGSYHGKDGFDTFTHKKSILHQTTHFDLPLRYPPYSNRKDKLLRRFLR